MASKLCLIADDSVTVRRIARKILQKMEFEIDEAEDGQVALTKCQSRMPDAILLDWNMPAIDGMEFLRLLRRMENGRSPVVVFCTTEASIEHIRAALDAGADEYVIKPFDAETLLSKFNLCFSGRSSLHG